MSYSPFGITKIHLELLKSMKSYCEVGSIFLKRKSSEELQISAKLEFTLPNAYHTVEQQTKTVQYTDQHNAPVVQDSIVSIVPVDVWKQCQNKDWVVVQFKMNKTNVGLKRL